MDRRLNTLRKTLYIPTGIPLSNILTCLKVHNSKYYNIAFLIKSIVYNILHTNNNLNGCLTAQIDVLGF